MKEKIVVWRAKLAKDPKFYKTATGEFVCELAFSKIFTFFGAGYKYAWAKRSPGKVIYGLFTKGDSVSVTGVLEKRLRDGKLIPVLIVSSADLNYRRESNVQGAAC